MQFRLHHRVALLLLPLFESADGLFAQQIAIQQPTIDEFSVGTTVSVPDRGRMQLGGVGRGASSRSVYGPPRTSSSFGRSLSGGSVSVGVTIHDFDELDRQTLAAAGRQAPINPRAERAYQVLHERSRRETAARVASAQAGSKVAAAPSRRGSLSAGELYERGLKAETSGNAALAAAFFRASAAGGSTAAGDALQRLSASSGIPRKVNGDSREPIRVD